MFSHRQDSHLFSIFGLRAELNMLFGCFIFCSFFLVSSPSPAKPVSEQGHWTGQHHRRLSRAWPGGDAHTHGTHVRLYFYALKDEDSEDLETTSLSQKDLLSMSWINNWSNLQYIYMYIYLCVFVRDNVSTYIIRYILRIPDNVISISQMVGREPKVGHAAVLFGSWLQKTTTFI